MLHRLLLLAVVVVLNGCIPIPVPTQASAPRYTESEINALEVGAMDRNAVLQRLGSPTLTRAQDRLWIYLWRVESGTWFAIPLAPIVAGDVGPIHSQQFVLFLEFDAAGTLRDRAFGTARKGDAPGRFCTSDDLCLEHEVGVAVDVGRSGAVSYGFADDWSAVSVPSRGARPGLAVEHRPEGCTVTLWPEERWGRRLHSLRFADPPGGIPIALDGEPDLARYHWVPADQVLELEAAAGTHTVRVMDPWSQPASRTWRPLTVSSATFDCAADEHVYLEVGATVGEHETVHLPIELRRVDSVAAGALVASRRLVVAR